MFEFRSENPIIDIYRRYLADNVPELLRNDQKAADVEDEEHYTGANNNTLPSVADLEDYLQQADSGQQFSLRDEFPPSSDYDAADEQSPDADEDKETLENKSVTIDIRPSALLADLQVSVNEQLVERQSQQSSLAENSIDTEQDTEQDTDFEIDKEDLEEGLQALQALQSAQKRIVPDGFSDIYAQYVKQKAKTNTEASAAPGSLLRERVMNFVLAIANPKDHNLRDATGMLQRHQLDDMELPSTHEMDAYCKGQAPERELWQDGSNAPSSETRFTPDKIDQLTDDMLATPGLSSDQYQALVRRMGADQVVDRFCDTEKPLSLCPDAIAALNNGDNALPKPNRQRMIERLCQEPMTRDAATALASIQTKKIPKQARDAVKNSLSQYLKAFSNDHKSQVLDQDDYAHLFNVFDQYSQLSLSKEERQDKDKISELFYDLDLDPAFIQQLPKKEQSIVNKAYQLYGVAAQLGAFNGTTLSVGAGEGDHEVGAIVKSNVPVGLPSGSSSSMVPYTPYNNGSVLPIDLGVGDHSVFPGAGNDFYGRSPNDQNLFDFPKYPVPTEFRPLEDFTPSKLDENALNIAYVTYTPPGQPTSAPNASQTTLDAPPVQPTSAPSSVQAQTKIIEADTKLNFLATLLDSATNDSPTVTKIKMAINEIAPSNATASDPDQPSVLMTDTQQSKFTELQEKAPLIIEKLQTQSRHATQEFFNKSELADSLEALNPNSNAYKACLQNAKDNETQEDFKQQEQALIDRLPTQIRLAMINQLSSSDEQQLQALQEQINTASALSENSTINETIADYGQRVEHALARLDQQSLMTEYQSQYDKLANQEPAEAIAGLDLLITTLESEISENKLPDDAETLKTDATERLTEKLEAQTPVTLDEEGLDGLAERQAAIQAESNPRFKTLLKDALNARVKAYAGQIKQSMASDSSRVSKTTIKQLTSLLNASNDIDTQSSIISQLGKAFQGLGTSIVNKGASLDVKKSPDELSQFKSMIDQNNEVIKFIQDNESPLASEPSLHSELFKGFARDSVPSMPESDIERLDHALLTARTHFSRLVQSMQAADRILDDKTAELIQNQVNEALPDLQKMSPEAITEALNSLPGQTSTSLQKQEPTVANQLDQAKYVALTTQLQAIDAVRKAAETAVKNVDTQVEKAQSPQKLRDIRGSISDNITPDPVTGTDQAQNAVYQAALNKVDEKIHQFQTNQQNLDNAIEDLPGIPEQSEQPLSLTKQEEQIQALEVAIQSVTAAQQNPGTELNDEQRQRINAQENWLESLQSTFNQGEKAVENISALTKVNEIGVIKSSDPLTLDDVVNNHAAVVERRDELQSSKTQDAIGLDSGLGEPVEEAIKTLDARRNALEDDYVKLQTEAYGNQVTAIQEGKSSVSLVQGFSRALHQAFSGPAKENTATSNTISSLDNDIQALHEKNKAIEAIRFEHDDNILTSRSAKNSIDESNQELCVPLSGQLAAMGEQSIAENQVKIDALNIKKGTLRAQQFADDKLKPKNDDSDLDAWVSRVATIQGQLKNEMLVDNDKKITQGFQEQLGITLAADIQSLRKAYTNLATDNEGLINSATRVNSIREMDLIKLEAAQADLTLMEKALALQTDGRSILEIDGQSLDDALRAVKTAIEHRERLHGDLKILDSIPDNPKDQIGMIQYANELLRTENDVDATSQEHLQKVAGAAIATCQNALLPSASTAVFAQRGAQDWLEGVLGDEAKAPPAYDTLFTEEQTQLLNSVQQLGSIKNAMADALSNDAFDVAFTNAAQALKAYDTADKFKNHVDDISNALPEGAGDLKQQLAGLAEQYSQVQRRLQTYAEDRNRVQAYQGNHNAWNKSLSAELESSSVSVEGLETLLSQKPELPTLSELSRGVTIDQSNSNLEEQAQDVISKVNEQLPAVDEKSALSALSDAHMTQLRNQNTSPEIEKSLSDVGQDSLQGRMLSNRRTTNNAKLKAEFMTRDRLKRSFDQQIELQRPTDERNLGETLVKMDAENLKELQASLDKPNDAITKIIEAGKGETDRDARTDYLKGYSQDLRRQISGQLAVRQQAVETTQATLNETVSQIQNDFRLDATELKNPTEVGKARVLLSDAQRDYGNACGRAGMQVPESDQPEDNPDFGPVSALRKQLQTYSDMYALNQAILQKRDGTTPADMNDTQLAAYKTAFASINPNNGTDDPLQNLYNAESLAIDEAEKSLNKLRQRFINDVVGYTPVVADEKGDPAQVPSFDVVDEKGHSTKALSDALQDLYNQVHSESVDDAKAKLRDAVSQLSDSDRLSLNKSLSRLDTELVRSGNQYIKLDPSARDIQGLMREQLNRVRKTKESEQAVEEFYKKAFNELDGKNANAKTLDDLSGAQLLKLQSVLSGKKSNYTDKYKKDLMQTKIDAVGTQLTEREKAYRVALNDNDGLNESQPGELQLASTTDDVLGERIEGLLGRLLELTKLADRAGIEDDDRTAIKRGKQLLDQLRAEQSARTDYAGYIEKCDEFDDKVLALEKERLDASTAPACEAIDKRFGNLKTPEPIATNKLPACRAEAVELIKFEKPDPRIAQVDVYKKQVDQDNVFISKLSDSLNQYTLSLGDVDDKIEQIKKFSPIPDDINGFTDLTERLSVPNIEGYRVNIDDTCRRVSAKFNLASLTEFTAQELDDQSRTVSELSLDTILNSIGKKDLVKQVDVVSAFAEAQEASLNAISSEKATRQQAVETTQATLNETVSQIQNDFPLDATELKNPTEVSDALTRVKEAGEKLSSASENYNQACGRAGVQVPESDQSEDNPDVGPVSALRKQLQTYSDMYALNQAILEKRKGTAPADMKEADLAAYNEALQGIKPAQESPSEVKNLYDAEINAIRTAESSLNTLRQQFINDVVGANTVNPESDTAPDLENLATAVTQLSDPDRRSLLNTVRDRESQLTSPNHTYIKIQKSAYQVLKSIRDDINQVEKTKKSEQDVEGFYKKAFNELDGKNANANTLDDLSAEQLLKLQSVLSDKKTKYTDKDKIGLMQDKIDAVGTQLTEREKAYAAALKANDVALNESQPDDSQLASTTDDVLVERIARLTERLEELTKLADRAGIEDDDRIAIQAGNDTLNELQVERSARTDYARYNMRCKTFNNVVLALEKERLDASTVSACEKIDKQFGNLKKLEPNVPDKLPAGKRVLIKPRDIEETDPRIAHVEARNTKMSEISEAIGKAVIPDGDLASASIEALQASDKIMQEQSEEQTKLINDKKYKSIQSFEDLEPLVTAQDHDARIQAIKNVLRYYEGLETRINECETQEALDAISLNDLSGVIDQDQDDPIDPNQHDIAVKKTQLAALKTQKSEQLSNISGMGAEDALAQSVVKEEQAARIIQQAQRVNMESIVENLKQINETAAALDENSWFLVKNRDQLEPVATLFTGQNNATSETHVKINQAVGVANSLNRYIDSANNSVVSTSSNVNESTSVNSNSSDASKLDGPSEDEQALITKVAGYLRDPTPESAPTPAETLQAIKTAENNTDVAQRLRGAYAENQQKPENTGAPGTDDEQSPYNFIAAALLGAGVLGALTVNNLAPTEREGTPGTPAAGENTTTFTAAGVRPQVNPDTMDCAVRVTCFLEDNTRHVKKYNYVEEGHGFEEIKAKSNEDLSPGSSVKSVEGKWNPADPNDRNVEEAAYRAAKAFLNNNTRQKMTMPACDATKRQIVLKGVSRCIDELKNEQNTSFNPKARLGASLLRELSKAARTSNQNRLSALQVRGQENVEGAKKALTKVNTTNGNQSNTPTVKEIPGANGK